MNNKGFTLIEFLAVVIILLILIICFGGLFYQASNCVEYQEVPVMDCYNWGYHTSCENRLERRCVKYE